MAKTTLAEKTVAKILLRTIIIIFSIGAVNLLSICFWIAFPRLARKVGIGKNRQPLLKK